MKILLDENLNWRLKKFLPGHEVQSVPRIGWAGLKNGKLLARAQSRFDVLISMDASIASQQKLSSLRIAVIALEAKSNRLEDTGPLMPQVLAAISSLKPGQFLIIRKAES